MIYSVSCWLERAEAFQPDDTTVKMLCSYLVRSGKPKEGIQKLEASLELSGDDTNVPLQLWGSPISNSKTLIGPLNLHTAYEAGFLSLDYATN
jgi:hypothetical protein